MEMCWLEDRYGSKHFQYELYDSAKGYISECDSYVRPIVCKKYNSSWNMFDM